MSTSAPKDLQKATATTSSATDVNRTPIASDENLACQWERCSERCVSAEALFEHICEKHVGRKSTNNLNLTCGWASCRTTTVKRDHITSHIRVHVPLKPHKCDFCGKAFKRPQDLKKHVKTHADDSVLLRSPEADGRISSRGISKVIDALHYRGASSAFYDQGVTMPGGHAPFGNVHQSTQNSFYAQQQPAQYGPVYYPNSHGSDNTHHNSYDNRKRGYETLNEFFGDAKRRQIDPTSYTQVGQRLMALHGLPINQGGMSDYMPTSSPLVSVVNQNGGNQGNIPQHQYALPLPNLRTKNDLVNIDQFLEQMQSTVYESSNAAAAAGVHQPGTHYTHAGVNFRQSQSPPHTNINHLGQMNGNVSSPHSTSMMSSHPSTQSNTTSTPALTPSSSTLSYTSGHSPVSSHDMSPVARNRTITPSSYPNLPSVSLGYQSHSTATPTSALGPNFENDLRRRYSGGMLQQSSKPGVCEELKTVDDSPTSTSVDKIDGVSHANNIDPALSEVGSPIEQSDSDDSARDRAEEAWIENIRVIEALRMMVSDRLRRKEYEIDDDISMTGVLQKISENEERRTEILYPTLRVSDD